MNGPNELYLPSSKPYLASLRTNIITYIWEDNFCSLTVEITIQPKTVVKWKRISATVIPPPLQ